jgi:hypothetical protein
MTAVHAEEAFHRMLAKHHLGYMPGQMYHALQAHFSLTSGHRLMCVHDSAGKLRDDQFLKCLNYLGVTFIMVDGSLDDHAFLAKTAELVYFSHHSKSKECITLEDLRLLLLGPLMEGVSIVFRNMQKATPAVQKMVLEIEDDMLFFQAHNRSMKQYGHVFVISNSASNGVFAAVTYCYIDMNGFHAFDMDSISRHMPQSGMSQSLWSKIRAKMTVK